MTNDVDANSTDECEEDSRERLLLAYHAAVKPLDAAVRVPISEMVYCNRFRVRDRNVVDEFLNGLPATAAKTYAFGTEGCALSGLYASLKAGGWEEAHSGFAVKKDTDTGSKYLLVGGNTRYLMLSSPHFSADNPLYTHGWLRLLKNEEDAVIIAEGHNLVTETVRPPPSTKEAVQVMVHVVPSKLRPTRALESREAVLSGKTPPPNPSVGWPIF